MSIKQEIQTGTFRLETQKAGNPATVAQIKTLERLVEVQTTTSQLMKRLSYDEATELIEAAKEGIKFKITG